MTSDISRDAQLKALYGFSFPKDLREVWEVAMMLSPDAPEDAFEETLGINLVGPFDVLGGKFDGVTPRFSALFHRRYSMDPPEFFTVMQSNETGFHWGYWFDAPSHGDASIAAYGVRTQGQQLSIVGPDLWVALRCQLEWLDEELEQAELMRGQQMDAEEKSLCQARRTLLAALRDILLPRAPGEAQGAAYIRSLDGSGRDRGHLLPTSDGVGAACPEESFATLPSLTDEAVAITWESIPSLVEEAFVQIEEGMFGAALWLGRELWRTDLHTELCYDLLEAAYEALQRPILQALVLKKRKMPYLLDTDILTYELGDFFDLDEALASPAEVRKLSIGGQWLSTLPDDIGALSQMTTLDAWGNELRHLPDAMSGCTALRSAMLHVNRFATIPAVLCGLPALEELVLARCELRELGAGIGRCRALKRLDVHQNKLDDSPASLHRQLFSLEQLERLSLAENRLQTIPTQIAGLQSLVWLDLRDNAISSIPEVLCSLSSLKRLDLRRNQIEVFPEDVSSWVQLEELLLEGNPISPVELARLQVALPHASISVT